MKYMNVVHNMIKEKLLKRLFPKNIKNEILADLTPNMEIFFQINYNYITYLKHLCL